MTRSAPVSTLDSAPAPRSGLALGFPRHVHLCGAGGAGLSGIFKLLSERGHRVTGHDRAASRFTAELESLGARLELGESHADALPAATELVVRSAAIADDDPQIVRARERSVPVIKYAAALGRLGGERTLAVAGTHGKTTSSWMLHHALRGVAGAQGAERPELAPGALIGGVDRSLETNAIAPGPRGWFAVEACEYDRSFLNLDPRGAIITNIEPDHLDYYRTFEALLDAFCRFADRLHPDGLLVLGRDVPELVETAAPCDVWRVGREIHTDLQRETHGYFHLRVRGPGWMTPVLRLGVPGMFNVDNAACAIALAMGQAAREDKVNVEEAAAAVGTCMRAFVGVERRFEPWGLVGGVEIVHDYAHHPTEVSATINAARRAMPGKPLHVLFQPHQESRTARFLDDFVESFRGVESVIVADVYGARAHIDSRAAGAEELARRIQRTGVDAVAPGDLEASTKELFQRLLGGSGALILGAGDVDSIRDDLLEKLALRGRS